jgi:hypothetical protein
MTNTLGPAPGSGGGWPVVQQPRKSIALPVGLPLAVLSTLVAVALGFLLAAGMGLSIADGNFPPAVRQADDHFANFVLPVSVLVAAAIGLALVVLAVVVGRGRNLQATGIQWLCMGHLVALPWVWLVITWSIWSSMLQAAGMN